MSITTKLEDQGSFVAYGPYGPIYIEFELPQVEHRGDPGSQVNFKHKLSANGWPVQRVTKGRYKVFAHDHCIEVVSDHPKAI